MTDNKLLKLSPKQTELLGLLGAMAADGKRCPDRDEMRSKGFPPQGEYSIRHLARLGYVRIEVYYPNWRVVTILAGKYIGMATARPKGNKKPHRTIDATGDTADSSKSSNAPVSLGPPPNWER